VKCVPLTLKNSVKQKKRLVLEEKKERKENDEYIRTFKKEREVEQPKQRMVFHFKKRELN